MKNIILTIFTIVAFIGCNNKDKKEEFIKLVSNSKNIIDSKYHVYYFDEYGILHNELFDDHWTLDKILNYSADKKVAIYTNGKPVTEGWTYIAVGIIINNDGEELIHIYPSYDKEIYNNYSEVFNSDRVLAIVTNNEYNKVTQNNSKTTDLSKIKLVDFRVCSDRDVERFLKDIDSLSEKEKEELCYMFFIYYGLIAEREYMNKDRFMDYYIKVKNKQSYKLN